MATARAARGAEAALAIGLGAMALLPLAIGGLTPRDESREAAVLVAPWRGLEAAAEIAARSGARIARSGGLPGVFILASDQPGLPARLHRAGAWIVVDPLIAGGCALSRSDTNI
jgi:hypothetical protein